MKPTKEFLLATMKACEQEKQALRTKFERQDAVAAFCQYMLDNGIFAEGEKEAGDGSNP